MARRADIRAETPVSHDAEIAMWALGEQELDAEQSRVRGPTRVGVGAGLWQQRGGSERAGGARRGGSSTPPRSDDSDAVSTLPAEVPDAPDPTPVANPPTAAEQPVAAAPPRRCSDSLSFDELYAAIDADLRSADEEDASFLRYVSLSNRLNQGICPEDLADDRLALFKALNSLSTSSMRIKRAKLGGSTSASPRMAKGSSASPIQNADKDGVRARCLQRPLRELERADDGAVGVSRESVRPCRSYRTGYDAAPESSPGGRCTLKRTGWPATGPTNCMGTSRGAEPAAKPGCPMAGTG